MNQSVFHRFQGCSDLPENLHGCSVAIGNFDGVHRGHQEVLSRALDYGRELGLPAVVLTFEPHPKTVFDPQIPVFRLTPAPFKRSSTVRFILPDGYKPAKIPESLAISGDHVKLNISATEKDGTLTVTREYSILGGTVKVAEYPEFRRKLIRYDSGEAASIKLTK